MKVDLNNIKKALLQISKAQLAVQNAINIYDLEMKNADTLQVPQIANHCEDAKMSLEEDRKQLSHLHQYLTAWLENHKDDDFMVCPNAYKTSLK